MAQQTTFDPNDHLIDLKGKPYLPVAWRLVWLRELHPDAIIVTEHVVLTEQLSVLKATIEIPNGGGMATGYGSETPGDFRDHLEKAETKALGRALAALGFGTQFTEDFGPAGELGATGQPVERAPTPAQETPIEEKQKRALAFFESVAKEVGLLEPAAGLIAFGKYPQAKSINDIQPENLTTVAHAIRTWPKGPNDPHPNVMWANHIAEAENLGQLESIGTAMGQAEVKNGLLRGAWSMRRKQFPETAETAAPS